MVGGNRGGAVVGGNRGTVVGGVSRRGSGGLLEGQ